MRHLIALMLCVDFVVRGQSLFSEKLEELCPGVHQYYRDTSTLVHHSCELVCNVDNVLSTAADCKRFCPDIYKCLVKPQTSADSTAELHNKGQMIALHKSEKDDPSIPQIYIILTAVVAVVALFMIVAIVVVCLNCRRKKTPNRNTEQSCPHDGSPESTPLNQIASNSSVPNGDIEAGNDTTAEAETRQPLQATDSV